MPRAGATPLSLKAHPLCLQYAELVVVVVVHLVTDAAHRALAAPPVVVPGGMVMDSPPRRPKFDLGAGSNRTRGYEDMMVARVH